MAASHFSKKPFSEIEEAVDECLTPGFVYSPLMEVLLELAPTAAKYLECARRYPADTGTVTSFHREIRSTMDRFIALRPTQDEMLELLQGFCQRWDRWSSHCYDPPRRQYYLDAQGRLEFMRKIVSHLESADLYKRWVTTGGCELPWGSGFSDVKRQFIRETLIDCLSLKGAIGHLPAIREEFVGDAPHLSMEWKDLLELAMKNHESKKSQ